MAHMINQQNGVDAIAYVGETPWHGLGQKITQDAPIEQWQIEAGLNYTVKRADVKATIPGDQQTIPNMSALYRDDSNTILGVVSKNRYHIVQPKEVLEFFRDLVALKGFHLDVAGALGGGERVWATARNGRQIRVKGTDVVIPNLLLSSRYDGGGATIAKFTTTRVVCSNTLQMALHSGESEIRIPHFRKFDEVAVKRQLGLVDDAIEAFEIFANMSAERKVTQVEAMEFIRSLFAKYEDDEKTLTKGSQKVITDVIETMKRAPGQSLPSANGTAWGLVNGVTRYVDFAARAHSRDNRVESAWFGKGSETKQEAVDHVRKFLLAA